MTITFLCLVRLIPSSLEACTFFDLFLSNFCSSTLFMVRIFWFSNDIGSFDVLRFNIQIQRRFAYYVIRFVTFLLDFVALVK